MAYSSIRVVGAEQLGKLGADLKAAGDKQLRKELFKACQRMAGPIAEAIRRAFRDDLPSGLGVWVASAMKITRKVRTIGKGAGVRFIVRRPKGGTEADLSALDRGRAKHPTFGHRPWVLQSAGIRPRIVDRVKDDEVTKKAVKEFIEAMDDIARKLESG